MPAPLGFTRRLCALQRLTPRIDARTVALALLRQLAKKEAPLLKMPRCRQHVPKRAQKTVDGISGFLNARPLDEAAYYISCVYAVLAGPSMRRELAMYFTPPVLARHIVKSVIRE